jgi:hypothetical protein
VVLYDESVIQQAAVSEPGCDSPVCVLCIHGSKHQIPPLRRACLLSSDSHFARENIFNIHRLVVDLLTPFIWGRKEIENYK